jgi:hypothetical protein
MTVKPSVALTSFSKAPSMIHCAQDRTGGDATVNHLLSTLCQPVGAEQCLQDADRVLDILDPEAFQTKLLQEDNRKMKADREADRVENNLVWKDIEGMDNKGRYVTDEKSDKGEEGGTA